jgi:large subunit ribosomal protein L33
MRHVHGAITPSRNACSRHAHRLTFLPLPLGSPQDRGPTPYSIEDDAMAKATTVKIKLVSSADTGFYYVTKKNSRTKTDKLVKKKYDPVAKKHVEFRETKIK